MLAIKKLIKFYCFYWIFLLIIFVSEANRKQVYEKCIAIFYPHFSKQVLKKINLFTLNNLISFERVFAAFNKQIKTAEVVNDFFI